jgi:hypothetical protein
MIMVGEACMLAPLGGAFQLCVSAVSGGWDRLGAVGMAAM